MPIRIINAPSENFKGFKENVGGFHHGEVRLDNNGNHHHYVPHKVFNASVYALATDKDFSEAIRMVGWRYLFRDSMGVFHVAKVGMKEASEEHQFQHINAGNHVNHLAVLLQQIEDHHHIRENHYQLHLLNVSPIYVKALWFRGEDHDHEFFIPLTPVNPNFEAGRTYDYEEFMDVLRTTAREHEGM